MPGGCLFQTLFPVPVLAFSLAPLFSVYFLLPFPVFISGSVPRSLIPRHTPCAQHLISCCSHEPTLRLSSSFFVSVLYFVPHYWVLARRFPSSFLLVVFRALHTVFRVRTQHLTSRHSHDPALRLPPWCLVSCCRVSRPAHRVPHPAPLNVILLGVLTAPAHYTSCRPNTLVRSRPSGHDGPARRTKTQKNTQPDDRTGCRGRTARVRLWNYCAGAASGAAIMPMAVSGVASAGMLSACFTSGRMSTTVFSS